MDSIEEDSWVVLALPKEVALDQVLDSLFLISPIIREGLMALGMVEELPASTPAGALTVRGSIVDSSLFCANAY